MAYIKLKQCKCGCGKNQTFNCGGYYYDHMPEEMKEKKGSKRKLQQKKKYAAVYAGNKLLKEQKEAEGETELELFFLSRIHNCYPTCENCGASRPLLKEPEYSILWRSCQAHLLPKRHFNSIETHPLNAMVLGSGYSGLCNCHDTYDSNWRKASTMKIWSEVINRFKILYPLITASEHKFIPQILLETL